MGYLHVLTVSNFLIILLTVTDVNAQNCSYDCSLIVTNEMNLLLDLKSHLTDPLGKLRNWSPKYSCCVGWRGVSCQNGRVTCLNLSSYSLSGSIPSSIGGFRSLQLLDLDSNSLSGSIPSSLGGLRSLQYLDLNSNALNGSIPPSLGSLTSLQFLRLFSNSLSGSIPTSFGGLMNLQSLRLRNNSLSGSIPSTLGRLVKLQVLSLYSNSLSGSIPPSLGGLTSLQYLYLDRNILHGSIPPSLGGLKNLLDLRLNYNSLSGSIPSSLGGLISLQYMYINANMFNGPIPSSFGGLKYLQVLYLQRNNLNGSIHSSLGGLKYLRNLRLNYNSFSGSIPSTLGGLSSLQYLYLNGNKLKGSIPSILGGLTRIEVLSLSSNSLSGPIPPSFGNMRKIRKLYLYSNSLNGTIPSSLVGLTELQELYLHANSLSGPIPSFLGGLKNLKVLWLSGNFLIGSVSFNCSSLFFDLSFNCLKRSSCDPGYQRLEAECRRFYNIPPVSTPPPPPSSSLPTLTGLSNFNSTKRNKQSFLFRHATAYVSYSADGTLSWTVRLKFSWIREFRMMWPVRNQGHCGSCWAVAAVTAVEAAYAITSALPSPPLLSVQQVIDCEPTGNCTGGWPVDALEYIANKGLSTESVYPYKIGTSRQNCRVTVPKEVRITHYEEVKFMGLLGLMLAVQQQPVVVFVEASSSEFVNYKGGILSSAACLVNGVDHSVVLVGYDINVGTPHWIIRNSWGPSWGEAGYMRLAIQGGSGICGINIFPGFYPVVKKGSDPCNTNNFGGNFLNEDYPGLAGTVSPCGRFPCTAKGTSSICQCDDPFVAALNLDGSQTCVPKNVCHFFITNPCGVGDCVNGAMGRYSCVCPIGYGVGQFALDGSTTCVPAAVSGPQYFTVPSGSSVSCQLISQNYGLSTAQLVALNKGLQCGKSIPPGTRLNVTTNYVGCSLPYAINSLDTCASIKVMFNVPLLVGPGSANPFLDCAKLTPGQQVCIKRGPPPAMPVCSNYYSFALDANGVPKENCASIIKTKFNGSTYLFFSLNPGLYCDRIVNSALGSRDGLLLDQVCLNAATTIGSSAGCNGRSFIKIKVGQNCQVVLKKHFGGKQKAFTQANKGPCINKNMFVNRVICLQK